MICHGKLKSAIGLRSSACGCPADGREPKAVSRFQFLWMTLLSWLCITADPVFAQRELRIRTVSETPLPFVTTVVAAAARHVAVCDAAGVLAVGHRPKSLADRKSVV